MTLQRIGRSEAGKRIWEAGLAYQASRSIPDPEPPKPRPFALEEHDLPIPTESRIGETCQSLTERVSKLTGVSVADILSRKRDRKTTAARTAAYYACAAGTDKSYVVIGKYFGRDHTTILSGVISCAERYGLPVPRTPVWSKAA